MKTYQKFILGLAIGVAMIGGLQSCTQEMDSVAPDNRDQNFLHTMLSSMASGLSFDEIVANLDTTNTRAFVKIMSNRQLMYYVDDQGVRGPLLEGTREEIVARFFADSLPNQSAPVNNPRFNGVSFLPFESDGHILFYHLHSVDTVLGTPGQSHLFAIDSSALYPSFATQLTTPSVVVPNFGVQDSISSQQDFTLQWNGGFASGVGFLSIHIDFAQSNLNTLTSFRTIYSSWNNITEVKIPASVLSQYAGNDVKIYFSQNHIDFVTMPNSKKIAVWQSHDITRSVFIKQ